MNSNPGMDNDKQFEKTQSRTGNPKNDKILRKDAEDMGNEGDGGLAGRNDEPRQQTESPDQG